MWTTEAIVVISVLTGMLLAVFVWISRRELRKNAARRAANARQSDGVEPRGEPGPGQPR
jgi:hypothetical protein